MLTCGGCYKKAYTMKKYLVLSDSHGSVGSTVQAIRLHGDADGIIFLGDGKSDIEYARGIFTDKQFFCVWGNCDGECYPELYDFTSEGVKILCMHGHTHSVKSGDAGLFSAAKGYDVILHGHTHVQREISLDCGGRLVQIMNPGAAAGGYFGILRCDGGRALTSLGRLT